MRTNLRVAGTFAAGIIVGSVVFYVAKARAEGVPSPTPLTYTGRLEDNAGAPASGSKAITIEVYDAETAGNMACTTSKTVDLDPGGRFRSCSPTRARPPSARTRTYGSK